MRLGELFEELDNANETDLSGIKGLPIACSELSSLEIFKSSDIGTINIDKFKLPAAVFAI